jgi:hypothetical protein
MSGREWLCEASGYDVAGRGSVRLDFGFQGDFLKNRADLDASVNHTDKHDAAPFGMNFPGTSFCFLAIALHRLDDLTYDLVESVFFIIIEHDTIGVEKIGA